MKKLNHNLKIKSQNYNAKVKSFLMYFVVSFFVVITCFCFLLVVSKAHAATGINRQINFQGKLVDNNGLNVADGTYSVRFRLYTDSSADAGNSCSGNSCKWEETDTVTTKAGVFQVQLGTGTSLPDNVFFNSDSIWLGIKVSTDSEMTPRIRFTAVPYAINAASLNGVTATQSASGFTLTGGTSNSKTLTLNDNTTFNNGGLTFANGRSVAVTGADITIGSTIQPTNAGGLTIDTNGANALGVGTSANAITFGGGSNPTYHFSGTGGLTFDGTSLVLGNGSDTTIQTKSGTNSGLTLLSEGSSNITLGQNLGNGNILINPNAGGQAALIIKDSGSGDLFTASAGATSEFTIQKDGTIVDAKYTSSSNGVLYATSANGTFTTTTTTTQANQCLLSGSSTPSWGACALGTNYWQLNATNALNPGNSSYDLLLGGNATSSAKFAFINNAGSAVPVATISATTGSGGNGNGLVLNAGGSIQSLNDNALTLGGTTTGNITLSPLNGITGSYVAPNTDSFVNLGTPTSRFGTIYAGTNVIVNNQSVCLQNNTNCPSQTNYWQLSAINALNPGNSAYDLLVGGNSTASAKFGFLNNAGGTPTASVSGTSNNAFSMTSLGVLGTTNAQTLQLGSSSTGNVTLVSGGNTALTAVGSNLAGSGTFTSSGLITANGGLTVANAQNLTLTGFAQGAVLYTNSSAVVTQATGTSHQLLHGGTTPGFGLVDLTQEVSGILPTGSGGSPFDQGSGAIIERINTQDLLLGATSTGSAKFAFINVNTSTPTASISANSTNNATSLSGTGILGTTNRQTLQIGNGSTGNILINSGTGVTQLADNAVQFTGSAPTLSTISNNNLAIAAGTGTITLGTNATGGNIQLFNSTNTISNAGNLTLAGTTGITLSGAGADINFTGTANNDDTITTANNNNLALMPNGTGDVGINVSSNLLAALDVRGNTATTATASVSAASTFAAMVVNNSGTGDIFTASQSGATKFVINNNGTVSLDTANYNACGVLATDANGNIYCSSAGAKETIAGVYNINLSSGTNIHISFTGAADSAPASASGTITFPANATKFSVQLKGAGGGGGGVGGANALKNAGGGGEGGYSQKVITNVASDYYVKIGGGGLGGSTAGTNGAQGTSTCFGTNSSDACTSSVLNATGGQGGAGVTTTAQGAGGNAGVGSGGDINQTGQAGFVSSVVATTNSWGGAGGGIGGGASTTVRGNGNNGSNGGGGSGGATVTSGNVTEAGGNGGDGYVSIMYYTNSNTAIGGSGWFQYANGVLAPNSSTTDVLIGSNATSSAKFGFLNVNSGTPTASLSAGTAGGAYMTATGTIQTTANQTLTLGGSTTGNIILNPLANNSVGIGTQNPLAALDVRANGYKNPVASISGQTGMATVLLDNSGVGDLFTASKSGATKFTILNNGNISWAGTTNFLNTINTLATASRTWTLPDATGTVCVSGQMCATSGTLGYWNLNSGTLFPGNATLDFIVGGTASNSGTIQGSYARAGFLNIGNGTPVASLSAGTAGGTYFNATGTIQTTANQSLTLGGNTTGNVLINPLAGNYVGIGTQNPLASIDIRGATSLNGGTVAIASVSGKTTFAALVVDNSGTGDLLTASTAGLTKFDVTNSGNVFFGGDTISASSSGTTNNGSGGINNTLPDQGSIVPNAGFEANTLHAIMPDGWVNSATSTATLAVDNTTASQGNNSLKFTIGAANQLSAFYSACFPMNQGQVYEFQYNQKANSAGGATLRGYIDQFTSEVNCQKNAPASITGPIVTTNTTANWSGPTTAATVTATANSTTWGRVHFFIASANATVANATTWIDSVYVKPSALNNGLDYAEDYPADLNNMPQPGDVVALEAFGKASLVTKADSAHQSVLGIVSTKPGEVLNDGSMTNPVPVALAGRVPVNVSTVNGAIHIGDYLAASSIPGVAVKAISAGPVIGTAMTNFDCNATVDVQSLLLGNGICQGQVTAYVNNTFYDPTVVTAGDGNFDLLKNSDLSVFDASSSAVASDSSVIKPLYTIQTGAGIAVTSTTAFAKATIANIQAGAIVANQLSTDSLTVTTGNIMIGGQTIDTYIKGIVKQALSERDQNRSVVALVNGLVTATQSATLVQTLLDQKDLSATVSGMTVTGVLGADTINVHHIAGLSDLAVSTVSAASISAQTITVDTINAKHIPGLEILESRSNNQEARIAALESLVSSPSATSTVPTGIPVEPTEGLSILPNNATTSGDIRVKGNGLIEGVLHIVGTLFANDFIANGVADFFGNVIFHTGVTFNQTPTFNSDTAGIALIKKGTDHVDVRFSKAYDQAPVINASITTVSLTPTPSETPDHMQQRKEEIEKALLADNIHFIITNKTTSGFTILLDKPADEDIAFSWLALSVQNPIIFQSDTIQSPTPEDNLSPSPIDTIIPQDASTSAGF